MRDILPVSGHDSPYEALALSLCLAQLATAGMEGDMDDRDAVSSRKTQRLLLQ